MKSDIQIATEAKLLNIDEIAKKIGLTPEELIHYGNDKAKVTAEAINKRAADKDGKLVLVTAISPTPAGEGKSTTTVGLVDSLNAIGQTTIGCLREPSLGPVFGLKGGAAGGGYSQVVPMEDINLHFTGDFHAITAANNLISACIDNHIFQGNELEIDVDNIIWKRCLDVNDRNLRNITVGHGKMGVEYQTGFQITVASEIMAILCLSQNLEDFKNKVGKVIIGYTKQLKPIYVSDLQIEDSIAVLMKDALKPNLVQTLENNPVLIHGGPFANIAHGCNSLIATKLGLKLADFVVTEAGFGADLGSEKFIDIKSRIGNLNVNTVVIVATIRALKMHGGVDKNDLGTENIEALLKGVENLEKHIDTVEHYGVDYVVAINKFAQDTDLEVQTLLSYLQTKGIKVAISDTFAQGSAGGQELAQLIVDSSNGNSDVKYLYNREDELRTKIEKICRKAYGADGIKLSEVAADKLKQHSSEEYRDYLVCMAKTPNSLTSDPKIMGRPTGFDIEIKDMKIANGCEFIIVYTGTIMVMPGLPKVPNANKIKIDNDENITGLS